MSFVITRLCRDHVDTTCAEVCPVDCIFAVADGVDGQPDQLLINPYECVDCGLCVPACPWEAIFPEDEVPPALRDDVSLNARTLDHPDDYVIAEPPSDDDAPTPPSPADVAANRARWGL